MDILKKIFAGAALVAFALILFVSAVPAHAQTVPTVGTTDIANVGGPLLSALIVGGEYLMITFGPPLLYFGLVVLIFWAIRSYVARKHPRV